uniref:SLC13 family permease n=1 Tax=Faecousia sp. TaxID=2952921 RepID=UPI004026AB5F
MSPLAMTLLILLVVFVALLSGKFGYGVVGGGVIVALILLNILTPAEALSGLANTNVVIMFAMTIISAGLMKTRLIEHAIGLVNKIGKTEAALIAGFGLIAGFMAQFMNAFLAVACLLPLISGTCKELRIPKTKVIYPVMIIALTFIFWLPIGPGAATYAQMNGYLESYGSEFTFGIFDMTLVRLPGVILTTLFSIFILPKLCPATSTLETKEDLGREVQKGKLVAWKEIAAYIIAGGTVLLMIFASSLKLQTFLIASGGALLMVLLGILSEREAFASENWGMLFLFAGILPLATALTKTGASDVIADAIIAIIGGSTNPWVISIVFTLVCFVATQFLSNTACVQVFTPLALMVCVRLNMNPVGIMGCVNIACTASYLTPMANPGIPLCMDAGGYSLKDCVKIGILPGLLICAVGVVWCALFFPPY